MEQRPSVVFRADGSVRIGTGHIMRCLTLANELALRGANCAFVVRDAEAWITDLAKNAPHKFLTLRTANPLSDGDPGNEYAAWLGTTEAIDADETLSVLDENGINPDIIVVDHYALGCDWENLVFDRTGARLCVIDDLDRNHRCEVLIDTTFGKTPASYAGKVPATCETLTGASYALLKPQFARMRPQTLARRDADFVSGQPVRELLIAMGGADEADSTGWMLDACARLCAERGIKVTLLTGGAYPHRDRLLKKAEEAACDVAVLQSVSDVAALLARADLAIGAAGSSSWERCCMGLPTISLILAENQTGNTKALASANAIVDGGVFNPSAHPADWADRVLHKLIEKPEARKKISTCSRAICEGDGALRVVHALVKNTVRQGDLKLRQAIIDDAALLHQWQSHPETRRYSGTPNVPSWETHVRWMTGKLSDTDSYFYIVCSKGWELGMVRLDPCSSRLVDTVPEAEGSKNVEISILTAPEFQGLGVGLRSLLEVVVMHREKTIYARVLEANKASQKLFARAGFVQCQSDYLVKAPSSAN